MFKSKSKKVEITPELLAQPPSPPKPNFKVVAEVAIKAKENVAEALLILKSLRYVTNYSCADEQGYHNVHSLGVLVFAIDGCTCIKSIQSKTDDYVTKLNELIAQLK